MAKQGKIDPGKHIPFMTTEHFTLQSARGIINNEIVARVNLYFLTLSSLVVALAFLAQLPQMSEVLFFFALVAFPALLILGFTSLARIIQLTNIDFAYLRAINRVRRFYADEAPELENYSLFSPNDDVLSVSKYGGYGISVVQNFLSMGFLVLVVNSLVGAGLVAVLVHEMMQLKLPSAALVMVVSFFALGALQLIVARRIGDSSSYEEYKEVRFPAKKE